jgi:hypothetical protein
MHGVSSYLNGGGRGASGMHGMHFMHGMPGESKPVQERGEAGASRFCPQLQFAASYESVEEIR